MKVTNDILILPKEKFHKSIVLFVACFFLCQTLGAQEKGELRQLRHEVSMACGYWTLMELFDGDLSDTNDKWVSPSFNLQYLYNINKHIGLGVTVGYAYSSWNRNDEHCYQCDNYKEKESTNWFSFGPTIRAYWFNRDYFAMYSRVGVAVLVASGHDSGRHTIPSFSPISMEWGGGNLRFYTEISSVGPLGSINGGLKYSLKSAKEKLC